MEQHFQNVCTNEKKFLLWTRTKPRQLSGPALHDLKKEKGVGGAVGKGTAPGTSKGQSSSWRGAMGLDYPSPEEDDHLDEEVFHPYPLPQSSVCLSVTLSFFNV